MIVVMKPEASEQQLQKVLTRIGDLGFSPHLSRGEERQIVGVVGNGIRIDPGLLKVMSGVENVVPILKPFKLASREFQSENTVVDVNGIKIGGREVVVMAGPCAVESRDQTLAAGADGLIIEVHPDPEKAMCDGLQSLPPEQFEALMKATAPVARAVGREMEANSV